MTCVIGVIDNNKVYIGADSASIAGYHHTVRNDNKIFKNTSVDGVEYIFGCSGSYRMAQLLQYSLIIPQNLKSTVHHFMCTDFIEEVRKLFKDSGYSTITSNNESCDKFLVGVNNLLFFIDSDFQVVDCVIEATGIGNYYSLAAYKALENEPYTVEEKIYKSLEIAEFFNIGVCSPFHIITT